MKSHFTKYDESHKSNIPACTDAVVTFTIIIVSYVFVVIKEHYHGKSFNKTYV